MKSEIFLTSPNHFIVKRLVILMDAIESKKLIRQMEINDSRNMRMNKTLGQIFKLSFIIPYNICEHQFS